MSDNKKYYYLKLKENFFDSDEMIILENMQDGYLYSNILLKLYLRSLKNEGKLMLKDHIPFNSQMLASVTRHQVGTIEKAVNILKELGLIEILDNGAIYITDIQNFIGESSTEGDRKRAYRNRIKNEGLLASGQMSGHLSDNRPPELEIELEKELEIELEIEREIVQEGKKSQHAPSEKLIFGELGNVRLTTKQYKDLEKKLGSDVRDKCIKNLDMKLEEKDYKTNSHYITILRWYEEDKEKEPVRKGTATDSNANRNLNRFIQ